MSSVDSTYCTIRPSEQSHRYPPEVQRFMVSYQQQEASHQATMASSCNGRSLQRLIAGLIVAPRSASRTTTSSIHRATTTITSDSGTLGRCYHCSPYYYYYSYSNSGGNSTSRTVAFTSGVPKRLAGLRFQHLSSSSSNNDGLASTANTNDTTSVGDAGNDNNETEYPTEESRTSESRPPPALNDDDDDTEEWIPPERPLVGDKGQSHVYAHVEEQGALKQLEIELKQLDEPTTAVTTTITETQTVIATAIPESPSSLEGLVPDWLRTRRQRLQGMDMMKPQDAAAAKEKLVSDIPVLKHTFLTRKEIIMVIEALGGQDIACILDDLTKPRMAGALGMIITTGANHAQIRTLAEALLRQLRLRNLEDCGVVGALEGIEGYVGDPYEDWLVLDCENYVVHFQTALSRKALNIEGLWSGLDGMRQLDLSNESEVDDYIAANPVPEWYNAGASPLADWDKKVKVLKKGRFAKGKNTGRESGGFRRRQKSVRWR